MPEPIVVNVRWWDGYLETFEALQVRFGSDLLWMRLADGANRHVPLRGVRWWSLSVESHAAALVESGKYRPLQPNEATKESDR